ncbi:hypothetical protein NQ315_012930 [Exocentrus adspersus]|uniref:LAGLIDADG homing endonuclease n=1 Tax=Exocentrus adspersus TaxID=1586481 RepID=A0AAV8VRR1_9CUCU|nr:hypothetical protein NQ315_012930 [Exocentrus adspersus]
MGRQAILSHIKSEGHKKNENIPEIYWMLHIIETHSSLNSVNKSVPLFKIMFPNSDIAQKYVAWFYEGILFYFQENLNHTLKDTKHYVICFDEALNKVSQKGQMDLAVRYYNDNTDLVDTRYLTSVFISGRPTSENILKHFLLGIQELKVNRIIQISMDDQPYPSVNWKFYRLLKQKLDDECSLIDLGSCGLHIIHGSLQTGHKASGWSVNSFLTGLYLLFKDVPTRRSDFIGIIEITKTSVFPLKFCQTRWVEGSRAANRALEIFNSVKLYVLSDTVKLPHSTSTKNVLNGIKNSLLPVKIAFFSMMASTLEPFLTKFQSNYPLSPYLYRVFLNDMLIFQKKQWRTIFSPKVFNVKPVPTPLVQIKKLFVD